MTMSTRPPSGQDGGYGQGGGHGQGPHQPYPQHPSPHGQGGPAGQRGPAGQPSRRWPLPRRPVVLISAVTAVIVAAALVAAVQALGGGGKGGQAATVAGSATAAGAPSASRGGNAGAAPDAGAGRAVTYGPVIARMPAASAVSGHPTPGASASKSGSASPSASPGGSSPAPGAPAPPASSTCAHPQFVTSDQQGGQTFGNYYVTNDMWNVGNYSVSQTLSACSYHSWYVTATMNNNAGDGAVKTYPNVHEDFSEPKITGFSNISATFAQSGTPGGIYEYAFDVWINGVADSNSTEVMVWTQNHGQTPSGSTMGRMTAGGHSFQVWKAGTYIAFVADQDFSSGTVDLQSIFKWIIGKGWLTSSATLGQIDYGVELVSTNNAPATFSINDFSITAS